MITEHAHETVIIPLNFLPNFFTAPQILYVSYEEKESDRARTDLKKKKSEKNTWHALTKHLT